MRAAKREALRRMAPKVKKRQKQSRDSQKTVVEYMGKEFFRHVAQRVILYSNDQQEEKIALEKKCARNRELLIDMLENLHRFMKYDICDAEGCCAAVIYYENGDIMCGYEEYFTCPHCEYLLCESCHAVHHCVQDETTRRPFNEKE